MLLYFDRQYRRFFNAMFSTTRVTTGFILSLFIGVYSTFNMWIGPLKNTISNVEFLSQTASGIAAWVDKPEKILPNDIEERQLEALTEAKGCRFNPDEWSEGTGHLTREEGTARYSMVPEVYTSTIQYERSVSSKSMTEFVFTPETQLIGAIIHFHDFFEVVVGDGDHYGVTFKANLGNENMDQVGGRIILDGGIKIGNDIAVTISQKPLLRGDHEVTIRIEYTKKDGETGIKTEARHFQIPAEFKGTEEPIRVSLGFSNIGNKDVTSAYFKCFKISGINREVLALSEGTSK